MMKWITTTVNKNGSLHLFNILLLSTVDSTKQVLYNTHSKTSTIKQRNMFVKKYLRLIFVHLL